MAGRGGPVRPDRFLYVLEGEGEEPLTLQAGQSAHHRGDIPHRCRLVSPAPARTLPVITAPGLDATIAFVDPRLRPGRALRRSTEAAPPEWRVAIPASVPQSGRRT
ncbi:cupin domain-containing protein [Kitasatospora sp. NPDC058190]|uniref:cupin domain-containing protein n=1 Tax=Kitasatospora sp. NPDC058190 TaxID=3346371 RepID=UPI0036D7DFCD